MLILRLILCISFIIQHINLQSRLLPCTSSSNSTATTNYYNLLAAQTNDCNKLKFLLLNKLINGSIVTQAILGYVQSIDFSGTNLNCCDLGFRPDDTTSFQWKVDVSGLRIVNGSARGLKLDLALLGRSRFENTDLGPGTLADGCPNQTTSFRSSLVPEGSFITFIGTSTQPTNLTNANLSDVEWYGAIFKNTNLTGVQAIRSHFHIVYFSGVNLTNANFTRSKIDIAICDPSNPPIVSNTTKSDGLIASSALDFCQGFKN